MTNKELQTKPFISVKQRLLFFFSLMLLMTIIVIISFYWYNKQQNTLFRLVEDVNTLNTSLINISEEEKKFLLYSLFDTLFYKEEHSIPLEQRKVYLNQCHTTINILKNCNIIDTSQVFTIQRTIYERTELFDSLIQLSKYKGFKDFGLNGSMRQAIHAVEESDTPLNKELLLMMRRHEKDYMLRRDTCYITKLGKVSKVLIAGIAQSNHQNKNSLIQQIKRYYNDFLKITAIDHTLGLSDNEGISGRLKLISEKNEQLILALKKDIDKSVAVLRLKIYFMFLLVLLLSIGLSVLVFILINKRLSIPLSKLSESIQYIANSNFTVRKKFDYDENDEIGLLNNNITRMLDHLQEHVNEISKQNIHLQQLNEEMELQNEEILAQSDELHKINKRLKKTSRKIKVLYEEQTSLIHVITHDLKSPLNNLHQGLQLLEHIDELPSKSRSILPMLYKVIEDGFRLIQDLLDLYEAESGRSDMKLEVVDLYVFFKEIISRFEPSANAKEIEIKQKLNVQLEYFRTEQNYLKRIMDNLLSNAIKFSASKNLVEIGIMEKDDNYIFYVKDNGPGFSEMDKQKMFKKFQRLSARPTGGEHSTGLGLSIVKTLVDRLNGELELETELKQGSTFFITLPKTANTN